MAFLSLDNARQANYEVFFTPNVVLIVASCCSILLIKIPWSHSYSMSLRLLLGILAPGPADQQNDTQSSEIEIRPQDKDLYATILIHEIQNAAKFHIGMLSISLLIGLAFGGFTIFWMEKKPFLSYVTNLLIALVCRTFFSILFDGVILLGNGSYIIKSGSVAGGNALLAFEQIFINLVLAFWLSLTIYIHARVQRNFKSEPTLNLYRYGVPGVAVFFAFIWIFLLQAESPYEPWWLILCPATQWVVNSFNLLCILIQLALVGDIARIMMKTSLDNDSVSLFRKASILMGVLVFIFWLQFGLFLGRLPLRNSSSYTYFFYFVDGIECASVCLILYFFNNWVQMLIYSDSRLMGGGSVNSTEELLAGGGGRGIVTIDSVFMTDESGKSKNSEEERDVVYSNVVDPQRWGKILDLYKRLNNVPNQQGTVVDGVEFYDCPLRTDGCSMSKRIQRSISDESRKRMSSEDRGVCKSDKTGDQVQKRNAFYSSKYLVLDSKSQVPKCLETRPSLSSMSGKGSSKEGRMSKDYSPGINSIKTEEFVRDWLTDNSKNTSKKDWLMQGPEEKSDLGKKPSESDVWKPKPAVETALIDLHTEQHTEKRISVPQETISKTDSVFWHPYSRNVGGKNWTETEGSRKQEAITQHLSCKASTQTSETVKSEVVKKHRESLNESINSLMAKFLGLATKADESEKPSEIPVSEPRESRSKPDVPPPEKTEKFGRETPISNGQIKEQKDYEPRQSDDKVSETKGTYLNQYMTISELQERRMSREKRESDQRAQAPKSIFSFPETISSMVGYFVNGRGSLLGLRTDPKLSDTGNLTADIVPRSESEVFIVPQSAKTEMKDKTQFEEQSGLSTTVPSKASGEEERFPMRKISSGSEFSVERIDEEQPQKQLGISINEKLPKSTGNPRLFAMEETQTSSESTVESRKNSSSSSSSFSPGSFSIEDYYRGLHKVKQKREQKDQQRTLK